MGEVISTLLLMMMLLAGGIGVKGCMADNARARAEFVNKTYGTNFTERDAFWNEAEIRTYLEQKNPKQPQENIINAKLKLEK